jgi:D-3-phosphoglycerate dehydrogenase
MPNISMPKSGDARICIIHKNVPTVINRITGVISDDGINISNMLNKSKKDYAYTMLDIDEKDAAKVETRAEEIKAMPEIIRVRII